MKNNIKFYVMFCFLQITGFSQTTVIKGTVSDTNKDNSSISIINNRYYSVEDVIDNESNIHCNKCKDFDDVLKELERNRKERKKLWLTANKRGKFKIIADLRDSLSFESDKHIKKSYLVSDLIKSDKIKIKLSPQECIEKPKQAKTNDSLYIFIGKKIKVASVSHVNYCVPKGTLVLNMDTRYKARYQILKVLEGNLKKDTITFYAYDHYGKPKFANYENSILYLRKSNDTYYQVKYQYDCVFKTKNNQWASPYRGYDLKLIDSLISIKPQKIDFLKPVSFRFMSGHPDDIKRKFPSHFYKIENGYAEAIFGNYVEELIKIKKVTVFNNDNK